VNYVLFLIIILANVFGTQSATQTERHAHTTPLVAIEKVRNFYFTTDESKERLSFSNKKILPLKIQDHRSLSFALPARIPEWAVAYKSKNCGMALQLHTSEPLSSLLLFPKHHFW
jgi:hypothetical protein